MIISLLYSATCVDEGVVMHVQEGKGSSVQVCDPITELIVMSHDKADLFTVYGVGDGEGDATPITVGREVLWIDVVEQEYSIAPFLVPHLRPIYCVARHYQKYPCLGAP